MKCKALLLLLIFLLNTVTGFACTLRMSINEHEEAAEHHHQSAEVTDHHHNGVETIEHHHEHRKFQPFVHGEALLNQAAISNNDPCCQGAVNTFNTLAKVTPQSSQIILLAPFTYIAAYHQFFLKPVSVSLTNRLIPIDERRRPPTYPIRIALQSFQI